MLLLLLLLLVTCAVGVRVLGRLLLVFGGLEELLELFMDSLGHLWQVAIVLASQVPLELCDLLVELVKVEFGLLVHLQVLIKDLNKRQGVKNRRKAEDFLLPVKIDGHFVD